ncbi:MAG: acetate kinase, partial [Pseudomonadota bacterium]
MSNSFVLVINSGSSSLKFAVIDSQSGDAVLSGLGECFGLSDARMSWKFNGEKKEIAIEGDDSHHKIAIGKLVGLTEELGLA